MASLVARMNAPVVGVIGRRLAAAHTPRGKRRVVDRAALLFAPCTGVRSGPSEVGDHGGLLSVPTSGVVPGRAVVMFHGGGYVFGSPEVYRGLAGRIGKAAGALVYVPRYRLAPEHPAPAQLEDGLAAYRWLLDRHGADQLVVGGDSAGGGLSVAVLQAARDRGLPMPAGMYLVCPWLDLTNEGDSRRTNADTERLILRDTIAAATGWFVGEHDPADPVVSPLFGSMAGLPPSLVQVSASEALYSDSPAFVEEARAAGVDVTLEVEADLWHVWHLMAPIVPEARAAIADIGRFVADRTGSAG